MTSVFGFVGSTARRCCLGTYLVLAVLALLGQTGITLYLFIAPDAAVEKLQQYQRMKADDVK